MQVWAQDEARIGLVPHLRKVWAKKGQQPIAASNRHYQWTYLYAFIHPCTGKVFWLILPVLNNEAFEISLQLFARQLRLGKNKRVILVIDGAGFHRANNLLVPEGIHLHFLPPYSPELQPIEQLWPLTHEAHANRLFHSIADLENALAVRCKWLTNNPKILKARTNFYWWPN